MISRSLLHQAVERIAATDPESGAALRGMLAAGLVTVPRARNCAAKDPRFHFRGEPVRVRRHLCFEHGADAVAERLLVKYGELAARERLLRRSDPSDWRTEGRRIREAGQSFLLDHLLAALGADGDACRRLAPLTARAGAGADHHALIDETHPLHLYRGVVGTDIPARFVRLPFSRDILEQAAGANLELFTLRLLLDSYLRGKGRTFFACLVRGRLAGILQLDRRRRPAGSELEIVRIATAAGGQEEAAGFDRDDPVALPGCGSLLVAGAWLHWRERHPDLRRLVLTSELAASGFYESAGFTRRRPYEYTLLEPRGHVLRNLIAMGDYDGGLPERVVTGIGRLVSRQATRYAGNDAGGPGPAAAARRREAALFFEECFRCRRRPEWPDLAVRALVAKGQGKPFCEGLLTAAAEYGLVRRPGTPRVPDPPILVVVDDRYAGHLAEVLHLEGPGRLRAVRDLLIDPSLDGRWLKVPPRRLTVRELRSVHTRSHVRRMSRSAGRRLVSVGRDALATSASFEVARLAAGGVCNLVDAIVAGPSRRGFAFVRPPGHHAGPDAAMGFCLFNNVALGARRLLRKHGLPRVMIVDLDAHHGNGTQEIFYAEDAVLYASVHRRDSFPWTGSAEQSGSGAGDGYTINIPVDRHVDDESLSRIVHQLIRPVALQYRPAFILVSCGFDLYRHDPVAGARVTPEGFAVLTRQLSEIADEVSGGRIAFVLEGGYSHEGIRRCGLAVLRALCGVSEPDPSWRRRLVARSVADDPALRSVLAIQRRHWKI